MNRGEFMRQLKALLADISAEEREEALQYYRDYFEDAGVENEEAVIRELGSPESVAAQIKADLKVEAVEEESKEAGTTATEEAGGKRRNLSGKNLLLMIVIAVLGLCALPILIPITMSIAMLAVGIVVAAFSFFIGLVFGALGIGAIGLGTVVLGIVWMTTETALGVLTAGLGLLLAVLGLVATVGAVKLCFIVYPVMARGLVNLCRWPFHRMKKA